MNKYFFASLLLLLPLLGRTATKGVDVIYGEDDRVDVFASKNPVFVELARSTAAMMNPEYIHSSEAELKIKADSLSDRGVCKQERFSHQTAAANCSGFLVADNLLVTAGHCIKSDFDCEAFKWVFDYRVEYSEQTLVPISESNVYSCKRIIERSLDSASKNDYALIELDRRVADRAPLKFRRSGTIQEGAPLVVIGHPSGLPTKIADGAWVRSLAELYFVANLDTYGGNSGSAVFNVETGEVEGILVRGEVDYLYDSSQRCQISNRCTNDDCRGEDVVYISNIQALSEIP
jgi:V8-like Glu-specific endopeptidase